MATAAESVTGHLGKDVDMPDMTSDERAATGDAGRLDARVHRTPLAKKEGNKNDLSTRSDQSENGKKRPKEEKPPSKVVIRRLPPTMTKDVFINQISPIPEHDYLYFVPGDPTAGNLMGLSRAYINFVNQDDLFRFTETYDNYVFVDSKGQEFPAVVEFAHFQRIPKQRSKKKDPLSGCIETDPIYIAFRDSLEAAAADSAKPDVTSKQHFFETEVTPSAPQEMATTPLLEFLKQKRADRARLRDERKEERKRKEAERKLRQKAIKEKKEADEEHKDIKLLQPKDKKETANKESRNSRRLDKEKPPKEIRPREFRNRSNKNFSEEKPRPEKKEDRRKDTGGADKKETADREVKDEVKEKGGEDSAGNLVGERGKGGDRRRGGGGERKKFEGDSKGGEGGEESGKKNRNERNKSVRKERERKRRDDYLAKKNLEKKNNEGGDKKKSRNSRSSNASAVELGSVSDSKERGKEEQETTGEREVESHRVVEKERMTQETNEETVSSAPKRRSSLELTVEPTSTSENRPRRRNSLESGGFSDYRGHKWSSREKERRSGGKRDKHDDKRGAESDSGGEKSRRSRDEKASKSDQDDCKKDEKDTRSARRIRNKDRPSIQIYRPGMGKLSKQRLEKEKTLGSSTEVDSPSHSPSPVPKAKPPAPS